MNVLVVGSGGREHALVWKLRQSPRVTKLYCAPGNGGIALDAECLPADVKNLDSLVAVANQVQPDLTVIGPELQNVYGPAPDAEVGIVVAALTRWSYCPVLMPNSVPVLVPL